MVLEINQQLIDSIHPIEKRWLERKEALKTFWQTRKSATTGLNAAADSINQKVGAIRRVRLRSLRSDFNSTWRTRSRDTSSKRPI